MAGCKGPGPCECTVDYPVVEGTTWESCRGDVELTVVDAEDASNIGLEGQGDVLILIEKLSTDLFWLNILLDIYSPGFPAFSNFRTYRETLDISGAEQHLVESEHDLRMHADRVEQGFATRIVGRISSRVERLET